jgi:pimeloyl-ACP methyl ester carboxylesterase
VQADAVHQVVGQLRSTGFDDHRFSTVLLGGHSLGSIEAVLEAATYKDVDGLLVTGMSHVLNVPQVAKLLTIQLHPAILGPKFAGTTLDPGYLTTVPGMRQAAFHDPGQVDPAVIQADEDTKDVFSATETPDGAAFGALLPYSAGVTAPTLIVNGSSDTVFCGPTADCSSDSALLAQERPHYPNAACLDAYVLPGVGHDVNLHPDAPNAQARVAQWANALAAGECPNGP